MTAGSGPDCCDVCIIGAGPAGTSMAIRLAQLGHTVRIVERSSFPRSHIGESLSPGVRPQLEMLGLGAAVASAAFRPCLMSVIKWEGATAVRRDFGTGGGGLLIDRGRFDALLLDRARALGVRVMQPAVLRGRTRHANGWHLEIESADGVTRLNAGFLADARGRSAATGSHRHQTGPRTLALYGYWRGSRLPEAPRIEAGDDAWYWGVPLPDGTYNAIVFVDAAAFRTQRKESLTASYETLLRRSGLMEECRDAVLSGRVHVADATPHLDGESIAPHSIKVGEAALALDPLSSSGVQKAINTALTGAVVVNTLLRCPEQADAARRFYVSNLTDASDRHRRWAAQHYAAAASSNAGQFWQARAGSAVAEPEPVVPSIDFGGMSPAALPVALSPEATFEDEPCIVGDLVALKPALSHPGLERPVAFLGGCELVTLLRPLHAGMPLGALMDQWRIPRRSKPAIAKWLLDHRVLTPHTP